MILEHSLGRNGISRRTLMSATGAALAVGVGEIPASGQQPVSALSPRSPADWLPKKVKRGGDSSEISGGAPNGGQHHLTSFISTEAGLTAAKFNRQMGWAVQIKPSGYRGVPIYTIHDLRINLDSHPVDTRNVTFVYNNTSYRPEQLKDLMGMQWWVFDWATLFVPGPIEPGDHEVEVLMKYSNTYFVSVAEMGEKVRLPYKADEVALLCL